MKLKIRLVLLAVILCMVSITISAQTIHQVSAGDSTLAAAIASATAGDIIELITDGGLYTNPNQIEINKDLTIRAKASLTNKPVIKYTGTSTSAQMFKIVNSPRLLFQDLDLNGDGTAQGGAAIVKYIFRIESGDTASAIRLKIAGCVLQNSSDKLIKPYANTGIDSLIIYNSIFHHGGSEGVVLYSGSSSDPKVYLKYAEFVNCTFYSITREAIKADTNPDTKLLIDHCTFYNSGGTSKGLIYVDDLKNVEIKNSIFAKSQFADNIVRLESNENYFHHNIIWDVVNWEIDNSTNVTDTIHADPLFTDPANADFTLGDTSPAIGFADDGLAAGDLRWGPQQYIPKTIFVESGENTLSAAIAQAGEGDVIELITSGGLYTYNIDEKMVINKKLTVRAKENLAQKPVLRNITAGTTSARIFEIQAGGHLTLIGLDLDGRSADGGAAYSKQAVRGQDINEPVGYFSFSLIMRDCLIHDMTEGFFKAHYNTKVDTLIVEDCVMWNSQKEGILLYESSGLGPDVNYVSIENCTFANVAREAFKSEGNNPKVVINHCTFDNCGGSGKRIVYPNGALNATVKNSIFTNNTYSQFIKLFGTSTFKNNVYHNVVDLSVDGSSVTVSDTLRADPLYMDAANLDFTLASNSPARAFADDGLPAGDLRWSVDPNSVSVALITQGKGIVTLSPAGGVYAPGTQVTVTAVPDPGWIFKSWTGITVFPPDANPAVITVNSDITITAKFVSALPQVTLILDTLGLGYVTISPSASEEGTYAQGTEVTLTAVPRINWQFNEWKGDITGTTNPVKFKLDSSMNVTASFKSIFTQFALNIQTEGEGSVSASPRPILGTYDSAAVVTLTASALQGWQFKEWTGDLTGTDAVTNITMESNKNIKAVFQEKVFTSGTMEIDTTWDLRDAVEFANNNSYIDTLLLTTSGGIYTSTSPSDVAVWQPLAIIAAPGLEKKPILTNSDTEKANDDIFRVFNDFTLAGVILDGGHEQTHGPKYAIRLSHYASDSVKQGSDITITNVDFMNFFEDKSLTKDGHAFKIDIGVKAGDVLFENCNFNSFGYEAIRISDTEKWLTDGPLESLTIRNCTFTNVDAEAVRYYSDLDAATPDAPVLIEHVTVNNSATRAFYLKNSGGAILRNVIISNSRPSGLGDRDGDLMDVQGNTGSPSYVSYIDTFNVKPVDIKALDGLIDSSTIWGINPMYEDAVNFNYTLLASSHLYGLGSDGEALGDLRWAVNEPTHVHLNVTIEGNGIVSFNPLPVGKTYDPGQAVTITAVPDSGYKFVEWTGDVTGTDNPKVVTMDAAKNIAAKFDLITSVDKIEIPEHYALDQNYPNPFNPSTLISYALPVQSVVTIRIFDMLGKQVTALVNNSDMAAGYHHANWNGSNNSGQKVSSGIYIYRIEAKGLDGQNFIQTKKMMLLK